MHYQLCPKCNGQGILSKPPWVPADIHQWSSTQASFTCDVCNGNKVLLVPNGLSTYPLSETDYSQLQKAVEYYP